MCEKVERLEIGKVYADQSGERMLVLRDVPKQEVGCRADPSFDYVEVVFASRLDQSNGFRRKKDGKYPPYAHWDQHPAHPVLKKEK